MPKNTFANIPPEKQTRILEAAAVLFADRGFDRTDVAEIAKKAGVAKGSLYNYFETKDDLYLHVCRLALDRWRQAAYGGLSPEWDIYRQLRHLFHQGAAFARQHPEYVRLYLSISVPGLERFAEVLSPDVEKYFADHFKELLRAGIERGLVRADVDVNLAAFLINSVYATYILALVSRHYRIRMKEYLEIKGGREAEREILEDHYDRVVGLVRGFLDPKGGPDQPA